MSSEGTYRDGTGEDMTDEQVREMLRIHLLDGWYAQYRDVDITLHRDGGATIHLELDDNHVRGMAEVW